MHIDSRVDSWPNPAGAILVFDCRFSIKMHDFRSNQKLAMQISRQDLVQSVSVCAGVCVALRVCVCVLSPRELVPFG